MKYLVLIPAQGESKGLPQKNIWLMCGKLLFAQPLFFQSPKWKGVLP